MKDIRRPASVRFLQVWRRRAFRTDHWTNIQGRLGSGGEVNVVPEYGEEIHQQIFKIIVRQCGAHGVDTTGHKRRHPLTSSYNLLSLSPRAYITVTNEHQPRESQQAASVLCPAVWVAYLVVRTTQECFQLNTWPLRNHNVASVPCADFVESMPRCENNFNTRIFPSI